LTQKELFPLDNIEFVAILNVVTLLRHISRIPYMATCFSLDSCEKITGVESTPLFGGA